MYVLIELCSESHVDGPRWFKFGQYVIPWHHIEHIWLREKLRPTDRKTTLKKAAVDRESLDSFRKMRIPLSNNVFNEDVAIEMVDFKEDPTAQLDPIYKAGIRSDRYNVVSERFNLAPIAPSTATQTDVSVSDEFIENVDGTAAFIAAVNFIFQKTVLSKDTTLTLQNWSAHADSVADGPCRSFINGMAPSSYTSYSSIFSHSRVRFQKKTGPTL